MLKSSEQPPYVNVHDLPFPTTYDMTCFGNSEAEVIFPPCGRRTICRDFISQKISISPCSLIVPSIVKTETKDLFRKNKDEN